MRRGMLLWLLTAARLAEIMVGRLKDRRHPLRPLPNRLLLGDCTRCHRHLLALINESCSR